ncbi:Succinate dehydrogenase cytochrome B subunit, mitochondrial [Smittium culicis]|uniref:Succinate dehydrogenase cytochrome B subunit, mitochondrial n=1 Tax=Smittium culicis TaxID=133412 RepID=A0A1R1Y791_9FUNG|nr:Succinate dehydrogenase cytochrome B subunit, mitochondrial [Smittium culicis]
MHLLCHRPLFASRISNNASLTLAQKPYSTFKEISVEAKKNRPLSPHLNIYKPALSFYMSGANRITALSFSALSLVGCVSAALAPLFGLHFDSTVALAYVASIPDPIFYSVKFAGAAVVSYHSIAGIRFLIWSRAKLLSLKQVQSSGIAVLAISAACASYLTFFF